MTQLTLELEKKTEGMRRAAGKNAEILQRFRDIALDIMLPEITIDDIRAVADRRSYQYTPSNWLGNVFTDGNWTWTGRAFKHQRMREVTAGL